MARKFDPNKYRSQYMNNSDYNYEKGNRVIENPEDAINTKSRIELPQLSTQRTNLPTLAEPSKQTYTKDQVMTSLMKSGNYDPNKDTEEFAETRKKNFLNNVEYYFNNQDEYRKKFLEEQAKPNNVISKLGQTGVGKFFNKVGEELADAATMYTGLDKYQNKESTGNKIADGLADMIGKGAALAVNPLGQGSSINSALSPLGKGAERVASKINVPVLNKIVPSAAKGAAEFAGLGTMESYGRGENIEDTLKNVGSNALSGALFGGTTKAIGMALPKLKNSVTKTNIYEEGIQSANGKFKPTSKPINTIDEVSQTNTQVNTPKINIPKVKINDEIVLNDNGMINGGIITKANKNGTFEVKIETNKGIEYRTVKPGKEDMFESVLSKPTHTMDIPLSDRNFDNVGSKNVKSYQYLHPELKSDIQKEANILKGELERTIRPEKGSNYINGERIGFGNERVTSRDMATIKDVTGKSYGQINKAIDKIIKDNGAENNALSKKIELILDERLTKGYVDDFGNSIPANKNYVNIKNTIESQSPNYKMNLQLFPLKTPQVKPSGDLDSRRLINTVKGSEWANDVTKSNLKDMKYDVKHNKDVLNLAQDYVKNNRDEAMILIKSNATPTAEYNTIALELVRQLQNEGKMDDVVDIVEKVAGKATSQGQAIQALRMWSNLSPEGALKYAQRQINKANIKLKDINPKADKIKLTGDETKQITDYMNKINSATDDREKAVIVAQVNKIINSKIPSSLSDKFRALQRMSMLFNPKTLMTRNPGGNVIMGGMESIKDIPGTLIDKAVGLKTGKRTTTVPLVGAKEYAKGFKEGFKQVIDDAKLGVDTSKSSGQFDLQANKQVFSDKNLIGKGLNKLDRATSTALKFGDVPFYEATYNQYVKQLTKLNKLKEPTEEILNQAAKLAEERTFQNESGLVKAFNTGRRALNLAGSKAGIGNEDFGLGNFVVPYTKTPANILDKAIDYSPVGLIKAAKLSKNLSKNQKEFVDTLARSLTGTGVIAGGYKLAEKGKITGNLDKDKDVKDLQRQMGMSPYAIKNGDTYRTYDWAQPTAIPLAIGADLYDGIKNKKSNSSAIYEGVKNGVNTLFNQSVMQGIQRFMGGYNPTDNIAETILNAPSGFIPTVFKQGIQLNDSTSRSTYDPSILKQGLNLMKAKLPKLNKDLEPKINTLGEDVQLFQGKNTPWNVLLNPGFTTKENVKPIQRDIMNLYNQTGEKTHFPRVAPKTITKDNQTVELEPKEITEYQRRLGEETQKLYESNLRNNNGSYMYVRSMKAIPKDYKKYRVDKLGDKNYRVYVTEYNDIVDSIASDMSKINTNIKDDIIKRRGMK